MISMLIGLSLFSHGCALCQIIALSNLLIQCFSLWIWSIMCYVYRCKLLFDNSFLLSFACGCIKWWTARLMSYFIWLIIRSAYLPRCNTTNSVIFPYWLWISMLIWGIQAPFDSSSVDNMRRLVDHSGPPGHIYPMAILCHDIMPPPLKVWCSFLWELALIYFSSNFYWHRVILQVEKEIGEKRIISYHGTGISLAPEISFSDITASCENPEKVRRIWSLRLQLPQIFTFIIFRWLYIIFFLSNKSPIVILLSLK